MDTVVRGKYTTTADANGWFDVFVQWEAVAHRAPTTITVTGSMTKLPVVARDVLFGDVFVCSGQSNMAINVNYTLNATAAIKDAAHWPNVRRLTLVGVQGNGSLVPDRLSNTSGVWEVASPATVPEWSAVCYLSAIEMLRSHCDGSSAASSAASAPGSPAGPGGNGTLRDVCTDPQSLPVGLIQVAVGATPMEDWMPPKAVKDCGGEPFTNINPPDRWTSSYYWDRLIVPITNTSIRAVMWYASWAVASNPT